MSEANTDKFVAEATAASHLIRRGKIRGGDAYVVSETGRADAGAVESFSWDDDNGNA